MGVLSVLQLPALQPEGRCGLDEAEEFGATQDHRQVFAQIQTATCLGAATASKFNRYIRCHTVWP